MEKCAVCERNEQIVKLLDAVKGTELIKICEECALMEDIPIIRKPTSSQLIKEKEIKQLSVEDRLRRMSGVKDPKKEQAKITQTIATQILDKARREGVAFDAKVSYTRKMNKPLNLVDNFNWHITMARKQKKLTRKQLAEAIGEKEAVLMLIENNEFPDDALRIITKIEQYLGVKLRKDSEVKTESLIEKKQDSPVTVLKLDKEKAKNLTIADLVKIKEERERLAKEDPARDLDSEIEESLNEPTVKKGFFSKLGEKIKNFFKRETKATEENSEPVNEEGQEKASTENNPVSGIGSSALIEKKPETTPEVKKKISFKESVRLHKLKQAEENSKKQS